jgi:hypothetical protein
MPADSRLTRHGRIRNFADHWARAGMPPADRLNHAITWNAAVRAACETLAKKLGIDIDQAVAATEDIEALP